MLTATSQRTGTCERVTELEAENARLRKALQPFAELGEAYDLRCGNCYTRFPVCHADINAAREALNANGKHQ